MPDDGLDFVLGLSEEIVARREIRVDGGDLGPATTAAVAALAGEPNPFRSLYVRGNTLVYPARARQRLNAGGIKRPFDALTLHSADKDVVALRLARVATFHKTGKKGVREVDPPARLCNTVLASKPWDGIPALVGIIEAPTVLPDGRIVQTKGYDPESGLLFDPGESRFPTIPERPTKAEAEKALELLKEPLEMFPFVDDVGRAVALSAFLTALVRRSLRAAPLTCFSAPKPSSGKTLLATLPSYVATGRGPYLMPPVSKPEDEPKRLLAALSECPAVVVIDNIDHPLRSSAMCIVLTEPTFTDRVLGVSETRSVETNSCFAATGNNIVLAGDLSSRALLCQIDPSCEKPDERRFDKNLHEWVPANRGNLAAAALTIIIAYLAAGEPAPKDAANFARFEEWQRLCRFPLMWLGCADPCATRSKMAGLDPVQQALRTLLVAWWDYFGDTAKTVKEAVRETDNAQVGTDAATLRDCMEVVAGEKGGVNVRRLGNFIAKHESRIEAGHRFTRAGENHRALCWRADELTSLNESFTTPRENDFRENMYSEGDEKNSPKLVNSSSGDTPRPNGKGDPPQFSGALDIEF